MNRTAEQLRLATRELQRLVEEARQARLKRQRPAPPSNVPDKEPQRSGPPLR